MKFYDTLIPYKEIEYKGIQYTNCMDFDHISRYKGLRRVIHNPHDQEYRQVTLETPNAFTTHLDVQYYDVPSYEENRLDLIAYKLLGSASYGWVIAYFNGIADGYTVPEGQRLAIPQTISSLFSTGEILASVSPYQLNLGEE